MVYVHDKDEAANTLNVNDDGSIDTNIVSGITEYTEGDALPAAAKGIVVLAERPVPTNVFHPLQMTNGGLALKIAVTDDNTGTMADVLDGNSDDVAPTEVEGIFANARGYVYNSGTNSWDRLRGNTSGVNINDISAGTQTNDVKVSLDSETVSVVQGTAANLNCTEASASAIKTAVEKIDDWDESDRAKVNPIASQAGVAADAGLLDALTQRVIQAYNDEWVTLRAPYTAAQANVDIITVGASDRICVKKLSVTADNANTVDVQCRIGFATGNTPTTTDVLLSHPGIAPGSGMIEFYGEGGIMGTDNEDLVITCEVPTGGSIDVCVIYKVI